jgi:tRNA nucleotidyltransferase (CCA-adding enzyme)
VPERVWQELRRALASPQPSAFLSTLHACGALAVVLPEVDARDGVPQRAEYHPEVDTGVHQQMVSDMAARLAPGDARIGFAALVHDLGKALTPADVLPKHIGHEHAGVKPVLALCERLKVPVDHRELAVMACREHLNVHRLDELRDATVVELLTRCDAFRRPERIPWLATVCEADKRGRGGNEDADYPQGRTLVRLHAAALQVSARDVAREGMSGPAIGDAVREARVRAVHEARQAG